jgi:pimeloyl-ACP methyl ester carboxylesterase
MRHKLKTMNLHILGVPTEIARGGSGHPVLLLPGLGTDWKIWKQVGKKLAQQYDVHILSLPKYATKNHQHTFSLRTMHVFVDEYAKMMKLHRFSIGGHSMGGLTALTYAYHHPHKTSHVIMVSSPLFGGSNQIPNWWKELAKAGLQYQLFRRTVGVIVKHPSILEIVLGVIFFNRNNRNMARIVNGIFGSIEPEAIAHFYKDLFSIDYTEQVESITQPTLILHGLYDNSLQHTGGTTLYTKFQYAESIELPTHHSIPVLKPKETVIAIRSFLKKHPINSL